MKDILSNIGTFLWDLLVFIHLEVYEMIVDFPTSCKNDGIFITILWLFIGIFCILAIWSFCFLIICGIFHWLVIVIRTKKIRTKVVKGVVTKKKHKEKQIIIKYDYVLKIILPTYTDEEYNVYVEYDSLEEVFDNKELYNETYENQKIDLLLIENIDRRGRVIKRTLELPE